MISLPGQILLDPLDVLPVQRRIELVVGPLRERCDVLHALHVAGEIAEGLAPAHQHAERPARLGGDVDDVLERISGGTVMPFLMSRWRWPSTCRSTVSTSALHSGVGRARKISLENPRSRIT